MVEDGSGGARVALVVALWIEIGLMQDDRFKGGAGDGMDRGRQFNRLA